MKILSLNTINMLRGLLFVMIIITPNYLYPQDQLYFNNRYDFGGEGIYDKSYCIIDSDDGYVIAGNSQVLSPPYYWWRKIIAKIDYNGNQLFVKSFNIDSVHMFFSSNNTGFLIKNENIYYSVGKKRTPTSQGLHDEGMLMCYDENLDTLWSKLYGEISTPYDTDYLFNNIKIADQNNLVITGGRKPDGLRSHVYLLKTDSLGEKSWDQSYVYGQHYITGYSVIQTNDLGYVIGAFSYTPGQNVTGEPIVIKTDSLGNQQWLKNLGGPFMDYKAMVCTAPDGNIIVGTNFADEMFNPNIAYSRINIIKLDNEGNEIWNKKYGESVIHNYLLNVRALNDGSIIAVGSVYKPDPEPERMGWVLKTNVDGDSLWYREYKNIYGNESRNYLYDIIQTEDSGFIACGYILPVQPDTGSQDSWVIKLDSIGCDTAGCDPTVAIEEDEKIWSIGDGEQMVLYPNPASDRINCRLSVVNCRISIYVYDMFGRKMEEIEILRDQKQIQINISSYPQGLYIAVLKTSKGIIARKKFVIKP